MRRLVFVLPLILCAIKASASTGQASIRVSEGAADNEQKITLCIPDQNGLAICQLKVLPRDLASSHR